MKKKSTVTTKEQAFDEIKDLYFNTDYDNLDLMQFFTRLGMIITLATVEVTAEIKGE